MPPKPKVKSKKKALPMGKLKAKADRAMQDYFRRVKTHCEMCGKPYQVAHHFIYKSSSNNLRYDEKNLIFVCNPCHSKFHAFPDPMYPVRVHQMRGPEWTAYINENRHKIKYDNRAELLEIIAKYQIK